MLPDTQALIENLPVTVGWLRKLLEEKFGHEVQLLEVAPLSGVLGMMSALRRVRLHWNATINTNNHELPETVIIKMPSSSQAVQNLSSATGSDDMAAYTEKIQRLMHNNEVGVYTWLSSVSPSPIPHPQIYAAHNLSTPTPIIVMEELEGNLEVLQHGFDEAQLFEITETLARFHAHCLVDGSWKEAEFEPMVAPLSGVLGMMSALRRVRLHWNATINTNNHELPETVIIKMPSSSQAVQNLSSATGSDDMAAYTEKIQRLMHNNEVGVYTWLSSVSPSPIPHPQIYAAHNLSTPTPIIVMEELEGNLEVLQHGFDEAQLFEITETLARFHAHCLVDGSWKEAEFEPMEFGKISTFGDMIKQLADGLRKGKPGFWECLDPLFEHTNILDNYQLGLMDRDSPHQILAHGDLWCPQIIWADDGRTIRGILDWQIAHPGSMMEDISRVLATCTKTELRRRLQPKLFDRYYEVLKVECEKKNVTPGFDREFLDSEFKRLLPYTLSQTLFACGIWANSNVLKRGDADDDARVSEIFARTRAYFEDANKVLGWE